MKKSSSKKACPVVATGRVFNNIELTKNQCENLHIDPGSEALGCGLFGCAYPMAKDPSKVVKITRDAEDVAALLKVKGKGLTPTVYSVKELKLKKPITPSREKVKAFVMEKWTKDSKGNVKTPGSNWWVFGPKGTTHRAFVLEVEKVYPLSAEQSEFLAAQETMMHFIRLQKCKNKDPKSCKFVPVAMPGALVDAKAICEFAFKGPKVTRCKRFVTEGIHLKEKLFKQGIAWHDTHGGNWGVRKNGKLVALDIGLTGLPLKKKLKMLAGLPVLGQ